MLVSSLEDYAELLRRCTSLSEVKQVHARISTHRPGEDTRRFLGNLLVQVYGRCGSLDDARESFERISRKNVFSWTIIISAYVREGKSREAFKLLREMDLEGDRADEVTFTALLGACTSVKEGRAVHERVLSTAGETDIMVENTVVNMYARFNELEKAVAVFKRMKTRSVFTWTIMISAYARTGYTMEALRFFRLMCCEGVQPNSVTFVSVLSSLEDPLQGKTLHSQLAAAGLETELFVGSALVNFYGKCGCLTDARAVFDKMDVKNNVTWNGMIAGYVQHGHETEALDLYSDMQRQGLLPDVLTLSNILGACNNVETGREIHATITNRGLESDREVCNALVHMYARCGSLEEARRGFERTPRRNVISWTSMIAGYAQRELGEQAFEFFQEMDLHGVRPSEVSLFYALDSCTKMESGLLKGRAIHAAISGTELEQDTRVANSLIDMYGQSGSLKEAEDVFRELGWRRDLISWTNIMVAYAQNGEAVRALEMVRRMDQEGVKLDEVSVASILGVCTTLHAVSQGAGFHRRAVSEGLLSCTNNNNNSSSSLAVGNALLFMYGSCGRLQDAVTLFRQLRNRDSSTFTALIAAYARHGLSRQALGLYNEMNLLGLEPREATFTSLFHACSHGGLLAKAIQHFLLIYDSEGMRPSAEHYGCMVDLLGRSGYVREAEELIESMPFEPDVVAWRSLLANCVSDGPSGAQRAAEHAMELEPLGCSSQYVLLSSLFRSPL